MREHRSELESSAVIAKKCSASETVCKECIAKPTLEEVLSIDAEV